MADQILRLSLFLNVYVSLNETSFSRERVHVDKLVLMFVHYFFLDFALCITIIQANKDLCRGLCSLFCQKTFYQDGKFGKENEKGKRFMTFGEMEIENILWLLFSNIRLF